MARKTNKTAHVLNLISKAKDEHQAMEEQMQIDDTGSDVSNDLLFMGIEPANDKSISEKINDNLEAFVEEGETVSNDEPILPQANDEVEKEDEIDMNSEIDIDTTTNDDAELDTTSTTLSHIEAKAETETSELETVLSTTPPNKIPEELPVKTVEGPTFYYINLYERLVLERLEEFQKMFEVCTCPRCTADVIALALTNLPAKYTVSDNNKSIPLLSFYREKFKTSVAAQLSSACIVVKQNPYH